MAANDLTPAEELKAYKKEIGKKYMEGLISEREYEKFLQDKEGELGLNAPAAAADPQKRECTTCGALVNNKDTECGICGSALTPVLVSEEEEALQSGESVRTGYEDIPENWAEEWIDKKYRHMTPAELLKQPPDVLKGISKDDSKRMRDAFNIKNLENFATCKYLIWAQELAALKDVPESFNIEDFKHKLIKKYEEKELGEILKAPTFALQGVSEGDAVKLTKAFNTKTIEELGTLKFIAWAMRIYYMAPPKIFKVGEKVLLPSGQIGRVSSITDPDENGMQKIEVAVDQ